MVASVAQSAKDWKGLTKNNLRKYTYLSFMGKCIVASILFGCLSACLNPPVRPPQTIHDRLDVYELAFHLYFRAEEKEKSLDVMRWACREVSDGRHISCYNLGLFLEKEGLLKEARDAYAESLAIRPTRAARSALDSLAGRGEGEPAGQNRLSALRAAEALCRQNKPAEALDRLAGAGWNRETLSQPFFSGLLWPRATLWRHCGSGKKPGRLL
jgi:tetratricopeptide (TPR) repeat protein